MIIKKNKMTKEPRAEKAIETLVHGILGAVGAVGFLYSIHLVSGAIINM